MKKLDFLKDSYLRVIDEKVTNSSNDGINKRYIVGLANLFIVLVNLIFYSSFFKIDGFHTSNNVKTPPEGSHFLPPL